MTRVPFVDLRAQYRAIRPEIQAALNQVLENATFILGPEVKRFEDEFARFLGTGYAIGVSSGLDALRLGLGALGVGSGDEVIIPTNTFIATALAVSAVGAQPVLVDCDPATHCLDAEAVEAALTERTKAVIPVHLYGRAVDLEAIIDVARQAGAQVVEDAAQAHGARCDGGRCGTVGAVAGFSFYPAKNLGAYGDAGAVTTADAALAERVRLLRDYGRSSRYESAEPGLNARLDSLQAAVLSVKLHHLDRWNELRCAHAAAYRDLLDGVGDIRLPAEARPGGHVNHLFVIESDHRDALATHLQRAGIATGVHYPIPIHLQAAYQHLGYTPGDFPIAERLAARILSLPMYPELEPWQIELVADEIQRFFISTLPTAAGVPR